MRLEKVQEVKGKEDSQWGNIYSKKVEVTSRFP